MELWIRTQDKKGLFRVSTLFVEEDYFRKNGDYKIVAHEGFLGKYKTKERALEILDEIQRILQPKIIINNTSDDSLPIINGEWVKSIKAKMKYDTKELSTVVYEMPKE